MPISAINKAARIFLTSAADLHSRSGKKLPGRVLTAMRRRSS